MHIDLSRYTKDELLFLHEKIRERLKLVMDMEALERISVLKIGDIVSFQKDGCDIHSIVTRTNQKTVSIITEEGGKWRLSPSFVKKVDKPSLKVLSLKRELFPLMDDLLIIID